MPFANGIYYHETDLRAENAANIPVVLVHGAGGTHLHWPAQVRRLPGLWTLAVDLPGHGRTDGLGEQEIRGFAAQLIAWAQAVGFPKAVWVGHSMGGAIVQTLALEHPQNVHGIGLVATGARLPVNPQLLESTAHAETFPLAVETIMKWAFSPQTDARLRELATQRMLEVRHTVVHNDFAACNRFDVSDQLENITAPALIIHGTADKMTPFRYAEFLASRLPRAELVKVPDAGHMVMLEQPETVADALHRFAQRLISPQPTTPKSA